MSLTRLSLMISAILVAAVAAPAQTSTPNGGALFQDRCIQCHSGAQGSRAPSREDLRARTPEAVVNALTGGTMRYQGLPFSGAERRSIAEFLTGKPMGNDPMTVMTGRCTSTPALGDPSKGPHWNGWSPTAANLHFQSAEQAGLSAAQVPGLKLRWAFGFPDSVEAWSQPTVAAGRVFIGSQNGGVYSLDAKTGCIVWAFSESAGVRGAVTVGPQRSGVNGYAAFFSDMRGDVYALDAATGKLIWKRKVESHPMVRMTGSPTLYDGRLYVPAASSEEGQGIDPGYACCTFRGSLSAVDANTGEIVWKTYMVPEAEPTGKKNPAGIALLGPSGVGVWSAPTIDLKRGLIYIGTGNAYSGETQPLGDAIVALDLKTGKVRWSRQMTPKDVFIVGCTPQNNGNCPDEVGPDFDFGSSPVLAKLPNGKDVIVAGQKSSVAYALDPDKNGEVIWQYRAGEGGPLGGIEWGIAVDAANAYLPIADASSRTPGGLHAVDLATGKRVWYTPPPAPKCGTGRGCNGAQSAAITVIPGVVFSGSFDGALRAFSTRDGAIMWEFDTNREFTTVNGVAAKGASINGPAPTVVGGMVYVNSGYGAVGGRPGNVLLAFGVD